MKRESRRTRTGAIALTTALSFLLQQPDSAGQATPPPRVIAWNDLGMHFMDADFSVFAILPPFNNVNVHLIAGGKLVKSGTSYSITYEGVADPSGSINTTSIGKTDFWNHVPALFGVSLPPDMGLAGFAMPGAGNPAQAMAFDPVWDWFHAEGVPFTPLDDNLLTNNYPMVKVRAFNAALQEIAATKTVVPVSDEMDCRACHSSGSSPFAMPATGWAFDSNDERDYRLNILALHDDRHSGDPGYGPLLTSVGYDQNGLLPTVLVSGKPVLCAKCHGSNALPGTGVAGVKPLTEAVHGLHAAVVDETGTALDAELNRTSCYTCHPGSATRCLRGAMGKAVAPDGSLAMQCQDCHGKMSAVGAPGRVGWLAQPTCQNCHTGTATVNSGAIRFTSVFDPLGTPHVAASQVFATDPNTPATGFSLYRFSSGHGDLQCSACHGSTHAIYPALHPNDNVQNIDLQGHEGTLVECASCHGSSPKTTSGGPHGMHPVGQVAVGDHEDWVNVAGTSACRVCHGTDYRGTVLSHSHADRTLSTKFGSYNFWRGFRVSCYSCHDGPSNEHKNSNAAPVVTGKSVNTPNDVPLPINLTGSDANNDPLTYRIVSQSQVGTVGLLGATATYYPAAGFTGTDTFTFAAADADTDSNLGTVTVNVLPAACQAAATPYGFGCPGTGDFLPTLSLAGCPEPGGAVTLNLQGGLGGSSAYLLFGTGPATQMAAGGCVIRVAPVLPFVLVVPLGGSGAGAGSFSLPATIPANAASGTLYTQGFIPDGGVGHGYSASNGLSITIQ